MIIVHNKKYYGAGSEPYVDVAVKCRSDAEAEEFKSAIKYMELYGVLSLGGHGVASSSESIWDPNRPPTRCRDCKGTGKYTGLGAVEYCRTCGGTGEV